MKHEGLMYIKWPGDVSERSAVCRNSSWCECQWVFVSQPGSHWMSLLT